MPVAAFNLILERVAPIIEREETVMREPISPGARLEATLRFLATGKSYADLQYSTRISKQRLSVIIHETCEMIYSVLKDLYLKVCC